MALGGRLAAAIHKEFRQFLRDPVLLILVLWLYTIEVIICAVALSFDLNDEPMGILDRDRTHASRLLGQQFDATREFQVAYRPAGEVEAADLLSRGRARLIVVLPAGYMEDLGRGVSPEVQLLVDGSNSMTGETALGIARRLLARDEMAAMNARARAVTPGSPALLGGSDHRFAGAVPHVENRVRIWYNPDLRFAYFIVISMIALAAYMVGVIHPAATIVKEKENGTIEQVLVTPLQPGELMLAKTLPTLVIGWLDLGPALLIARGFGVPFRGELFTFAVLSAVFLVSAIATGILIATWTRTLQQALLVSFLILFPVMFLSGTMTPIESMPGSLQLLSHLSPLRYYVESLLGLPQGRGIRGAVAATAVDVGDRRSAFRGERRPVPAAAHVTEARIPLRLRGPGTSGCVQPRSLLGQIPHAGRDMAEDHRLRAGLLPL